MGLLHKATFIFSSALLVCGIAIAQPGVPPPSGVNVDPATTGGTASIVKDDWKPSLRKDGVIDKVEHNNYITPWQPIREADVLWKKRVWREIDTRQKQNISFRYPGDDESGGGMYIEILMDALKKGMITAFSDDRFTTPLSVSDVLALTVGKPDTIPVELANGEIQMKVVTHQFNPESITKFRIKEDCIFDKNLGRMITHIIGLAPYMDRYNEDGSYRLSIPMFWLYYPDIRANNARFEVYNPENDVYRINWDDFFEKRLFASYIIKSTINNPLQDDIKSLKTGIDRLNESERLREEMFNKEHDLWVY